MARKSGTYKIECEDCGFEKIVFGEDVAQGRVWRHERSDGHSANYARWGTNRYIIECVDCSYRREVDSKRAKARAVKAHDRPGHRVHWKRPSWNK